MNREYRSIKEIEEIYFPKSFEERFKERDRDPISLGISMAEESISRIKNQSI